MIVDTCFNGRLQKLVHANDAATEVEVGQELPDFRGKMHIVKGGSAPHKSSSTGFVDTNFGTFYVGVLNLKWVDAA